MERKMPGKTAALEQLLLNGIQAGKWRVGEAIPSRNSLMRKYRLSRCTVERAVGGLIRAGILTAKQGASTVVAERPEQGKISRIILISPFRLPRLSQNCFEEHVPTVFLAEEEAAFHEAGLREPGVMVVWFYPGYASLPLMERLKELNVRQMLVNRTFDGFPFVSIDYAASLAEGLRVLLAECGRETFVISYDINFENRPYQPERVAGYFRSAAALGMSVAENHSFIGNFPDVASAMSDAARSIFMPGARKRGITILNRELILPFLMAASALGKTPGRDFHLFLCDYSRELAPYPGIVMLNQRGYPVIGEYMLQVASDHILRGELEIRRRIKLELV